MNPFKKIVPKDKDLFEVQSNVDEVMESLRKVKIIDSVIKTSTVTSPIVITTSDTIVNHGLNRPYQGYIITDRNANAVVYTSATVNNTKNLFIILKASATVTVNILFF